MGVRPELLLLLPDVPSASLTPEPVCVGAMMKDSASSEDVPSRAETAATPAGADGFRFILALPGFAPPSLPTARPADFDF